VSRADLLALTPDALAALANRGLVRRATKDLDAGGGPDLVADGDGTVHGEFPDGTRATLPPGGGLQAGSCTCVAVGLCRHLIGLALAYRRQHEAEPAPQEDWSPGAVDDETIAGLFGARAIKAAQRAHRAGYTARLHRPDDDDPVPWAELPTCTVRFLVPGRIDYAHTDAAESRRGEVIALAVWAFRAADEQGRTGTDVRLTVGGRPAATGSGMDAALELADRILLEGAMHTGPVLSGALRRAGRKLAADGLLWPAAAVDDLAGQLDAYHERTAAYSAEHLASLLTEVHARNRAANGGGRRPQVLGTDEAAATALRHVQLTALGCRIGAAEDERTAEVYLAQDSGVVLVLKHRWPAPDNAPPTGHDLAARKVAGVPLRMLATSAVASETASRSAGRVVRLTTGRIAKTMITPLDSQWAELPAPPLVRELDGLDRELALLPPRLVRPRVEAELVRVIAVSQVHDVGYDPGGQRLEAVVADAAGTTATVSARYRPHCPAALDCLADALTGGQGEPRFVSASVRRARGGLELDPIAVMTTGGVIVPDLAPGDGSAALSGAVAHDLDPLSAALDGALALFAEAAHRGLRHRTTATGDRFDRAAADLRRLGFQATADAVTAFAASLAGDDAPRMTAAWVDAQLRLLTAAELR
jgi:hypothetical protein